MLRLRLLGTAELRAEDGAPVRGIVEQPKLFALMAYLAVSRPAGATRRDVLLPLFWADLEESAARHALSQALSVLRNTLGPRVLDGKYRDSVKFDHDHFWCDVTALRRAIKEGRRKEAIDLYGGPFLDGLLLRHAPEFERWLEAERRQLHGSVTGAALSLASEARAAGRWTEGCKWANRAIALDPYEERAWRDLLACLHGSGNGAKALLAYERLIRVFRDDLGVQPAPETLQLAESIRSGSPAAGPVSDRTDSSGDTEALSAPDADENVATVDRPKYWRSLRSRIAAPAAVMVLILVLAGLARLRSSLTGQGPTVVRSLVVLPLVDLSRSEGEEYFADALTVELGHALSRLQGLAVISHGSAAAYRNRSASVPEIARDLNVDAAVEGQVQRQDTLVRVTLQLVDGRTDQRLWSGVYEGGLGDLSEVRSRVAAEVARAIGASIGGWVGQATEQEALDPRAYDAYLRGLHHLERYNTEDGAIAARYLERSIEIEPGFAPAHAAVARACAWAWNDPSHAAETEACSAAAREAIRLDEGLSDGHAALGFVLERKLMFGVDPTWNWSAAEHEFREAIRLNPNAAVAYEDYAELLRLMRRHTEAREALESARRLNPLSLGVSLRVGIQALAERRFAEALAAWEEILEADPTYTAAHYAKGATYIAIGIPERVLEEAERVERQLGEQHIWVLDLRAHGHALAGDLERAVEFARRPDGSPDRLTLASVYAVLGDSARALDELEGTLREDPAEIPNLTASPRFDALRDRPRFLAVRQAVGLP